MGKVNTVNGYPILRTFRNALDYANNNNIESLDGQFGLKEAMRLATTPEDFDDLFSTVPQEHPLFGEIQIIWQSMHHHAKAEKKYFETKKN